MTSREWPRSWSPDGRELLIEMMGPGTGWDLFTLPLEGDRKPVPLIQTPLDEGGVFSPDGRFLVMMPAAQDAGPRRSRSWWAGCSTVRWAL
jgi:hypothetical protein